MLISPLLALLMMVVLYLVSSIKILTEMATFEEAGVSDREA